MASILTAMGNVLSNVLSSLLQIFITSALGTSRLHGLEFAGAILQRLVALT